MDIILNDKSLDGQFSSIDDFTDSVFEHTIPILNLMDEKKMRLLKSQDTYNGQVTEDRTLIELFRIQSNSPELTMLKKLLVAKLCEEPFWEDDCRSDKTAIYSLDKVELEKPNCITEAFERNGMLLSFQHDKFLKGTLSIEKNGRVDKVRNAYKKEQVLEHCIESQSINVIEYLRLSQFPMKIRFLEKGNVCYAKELFDNETFETTDYEKIRDNISVMIACMLDGKNSRFSKDMEVKGVSLFEFRTTVSANRELRIFYVYAQNEIVFLNGCIKKSGKTPATDKNLAIKLAKCI